MLEEIRKDNEVLKEVLNKTKAGLASKTEQIHELQDYYAKNIETIYKL